MGKTGGFVLDEDQQKAVRHFEGPALVLAGPGSGKTAVLTERIRWLVRDRGVPGSGILVITFTRDAAAAMKQRFMEGMEGDDAGVTFGTFHAAYLYFLRHSAYRDRVAHILPEKRRHAILHAVSKKLIRIDGDTAGPGQDMILDRLSRALGLLQISGAVDAQDTRTEMAMRALQQEAAALFPGCSGEEGVAKLRQLESAYAREKQRAGMVDFDDMVSLCFRLFQEEPQQLRIWQQRFSFFLVDEAQDMNPMQYAVLRQLAGLRRNLFVVGDEDQSIYGFRGASPKLLLDFPKDFPDAEVIVLRRNYRCQRSITALSCNLIKKNKLRFEKEIFPAANGAGQIRYMENKTQAQEAGRIAEVAAQLLALGLQTCDIAILYRNRFQADAILQGLQAAHIPAKVPAGRKQEAREPGMFGHFVCRDLEAYLRLAAGERSLALVLQVMNHPDRALGRDGLYSDPVDFGRWEASLYFAEEKQSVYAFSSMLERIGRMSPAAAVRFLRSAAGYDAYLFEVSLRDGVPIQELLEVAGSFERQLEGFKRISEFLEFYEKEKQRCRREKPDEGVSLHTFHSCKGLEFQAVIIAGACEGFTPSRRIQSREELEEERRMFYVAMTRAKALLVFSVFSRWSNQILYPSRFIREAVGGAQGA